MPYKILGGKNAVNINKENKIVEGVLVAFESMVGKNESNTYTFEQKNGDAITVWGNASIDGALAVASGTGKKKIYTPRADLVGYQFRLRWIKEVPMPGKKNPWQQIEVAIDESTKKSKGAKDYLLKK